jgi:hypothetical protein
MDILAVYVVYTGWLRQIAWLCLLFCPYCLPTMDKILYTWLYTMAGWLIWLIWLAMFYMVTCSVGWLSRLSMLCWIILLVGMFLCGYSV